MVVASETLIVLKYLKSQGKRSKRNSLASASYSLDFTVMSGAVVRWVRVFVIKVELVGSA